MRRVLVTAGAAGIGKVIAKTFFEKGYQVWVCDSDERALETVPIEWLKSKVDVSDENQVRALFGEIENKWGNLDALCSNAGSAGPTSLVENIELSDWKSCLRVNLEGSFLICKYAVPMMKKASSGSIIFTSSTAGIYGYPNRSPYAAAKWAIIGFMKTMAMELGRHGIRSNAVCPGAVEGPRMETVLEREAILKSMTRDQVYQGYASGTSMQSFVEPADIANMMVFLASDEARFVSGQIISVDGHTENPDPKI